MEIGDGRRFIARSGQEDVGAWRNASRNRPWSGVVGMRKCWHPKPRTENGAGGSDRGLDDLAPRQHSAFPKVCMADVVWAIAGRPDDRAVVLWNNHLPLLSSDRYRSDTKLAYDSGPWPVPPVALCNPGGQARASATYGRLCLYSYPNQASIPCKDCRS